MYYLLLLLPTFLVLYGVTQSDTRIGRFYRFKRKKWKELKEMVSSQYDSTYDIYRVSFKMVGQAVYNDILMYFDNRVEKKGKKLYELTYYIENQKI
ncbi:MAG TPA: hypothetical protein EYO58_08060 [Flavobacteriales bacterium]|nr:hypothetical protein [Flavobacteriales bacterium]